ncbi:MAG: hypothetical protein EOM40_03315 [Clostridia bacterium]|nr:hypothetical protein [Clostridia bacterium]NCC43256.1 hypothetical protein [Clostridia bacterium]
MEEKGSVRRILWAVIEGLLAILLCVTPMLKFSVFGYSEGMGYLTLVGGIFQIVSIAGIGTLSGENWWIILLYVLIVTVLIVLCIVMAVKAYKGRGRIIYLVGNGCAIVLIFALLAMIKNLGDSLSMGWGYWAALVWATVGLIMGILNLACKWTETSRHKTARRTGVTSRTYSERGGARPVAGADIYTAAPVKKPEDHVYSREAEHAGGTAEPTTYAMGHVAKSTPYAAGYTPETASYAAGHAAEAMPYAGHLEAPAPYAADAGRSSIKVKYNLKNNTTDTEEASGFFHADNDDLD